MDALHVDGFVLLRGIIPIKHSLLRALRVRRRGRAARTVFNFTSQSHNRSNDDLRRTQTHFAPDETQSLTALSDAVARELAGTGTKCVPAEWVILSSSAGCQQQHRHHDFDPEALRDIKDKEIPLAVIVGMQSDTKLIVWPGAIRGVVPDPDVAGTTITFGPGDMVIFRGDLVHAGSAYARSNMRVHAYADTTSTIRQDNSTYLC